MSTAKERVQIELHELTLKITKLDDFFKTSLYREISSIQQHLLTLQFDAMTTYQLCLKTRLKYWEDV